MINYETMKTTDWDEVWTTHLRTYKLITFLVSLSVIDLDSVHANRNAVVRMLTIMGRIKA